MVLFFAHCRTKQKLHIFYNINYSTNFEEPKPTQTDWVSKLFMLVCIDELLKTGGADATFKGYHIGPDIYKRIRPKGGEVLFNPELKAKLKELPQQGKTKKHNYYLEDTMYWYKKYYGINKKIFMKLLYIKEVFEW